MLESAQKIKKIDLNYYPINHQWFKCGYIFFCVICRTQNCRSYTQRLLTKKRKKKKEGMKERKKKTTFSKHLQVILGKFP